MIGHATFSPDEKHRYTLTRIAEFYTRIILFIMLNPSKATATESDPTITRIWTRAQAWGFGQMLVGNIFALRSTDPAELYKSPDPVGPDNDDHLCAMAEQSDTIVLAWGGHGLYRDRGPAVIQLLRRAGHTKLHCITKTKTHNQPGHPLYTSYNLPLREF